MNVDLSKQPWELLTEPTTPDAFEVGERVQVYAMGSWYDGTVVKRGRSRVTVRYASGSGEERDKAVPLDKLTRVRPFGRSGSRRRRGRGDHNPEMIALGIRRYKRLSESAALLPQDRDGEHDHDACEDAADEFPEALGLRGLDALRELRRVLRAGIGYAYLRASKAGGTYPLERHTGAYRLPDLVDAALAGDAAEETCEETCEWCEGTGLVDVAPDDDLALTSGLTAPGQGLLVPCYCPAGAGKTMRGA